MERVEHLLNFDSLSRDLEQLASTVQSAGGMALVAVLFVPVLIAASTRQFVPVLAALLLSLVSLLLFAAPDLANTTLGMISALGSFLVALQSLIARRRALALSREIAEVARRVGQLEGAEHRRMLIDLKGRTTGDQPEPAPESRDDAGDAPPPPVEFQRN